MIKYLSQTSWDVRSRTVLFVRAVDSRMVREGKVDFLIEDY